MEQINKLVTFSNKLVDHSLELIESLKSRIKIKDNELKAVINKVNDDIKEYEEFKLCNDKEINIFGSETNSLRDSYDINAINKAFGMKKELSNRFSLNHSVIGTLLTSLNRHPLRMSITNKLQHDEELKSEIEKLKEIVKLKDQTIDQNNIKISEMEITKQKIAQLEEIEIKQQNLEED